MADLSVFWLRVAAVLYSVGLLHAILTLVKRKQQLMRPALLTLGLGAVFHFVSIVEDGLTTQHCPITNLYQTLSMCSFLIVILYFVVAWRYKVEGLSLFVFPLVFVMSLVATMGHPVDSWPNSALRTAWLTVHIVLVLLGYAALALTAIAALLYLFQEHELKSKRPGRFHNRLPALGTLDDMISRFMGLGFALMTLGVIAASTWAFIELKSAWITQPSIAISFFTWGMYLALVFLRVTAGWRGRKAAVMTVVVLGFCAVTWVAHSHLGGWVARP
jgi:ABC-type uncharacterized transport system permease subunit